MFVKMAPLPGESYYTQVPTHWIRDPRLPATAKAVLAYLQTHEVGYRVEVVQIIAEMHEGRDAIYAAVRTLVDLEYLVRIQSRNDDGKMGKVDYTFGPAAYAATYDRNWGRRNVSAGQTAYGFSVSGQPVYGSAGYGEPATKKNKRSKNKESNPPLPPDEPVPSAVGPPVDEQGGDCDEPETRPEPPETRPEPPPSAAVSAEAEQVLRRVLAAIPEPQRPQGPGRKRLVHLVSAALIAGWPPGALAQALTGAHQGAGSVGAVLASRLRGLGSPPPSVTPQETAPWCGRCDSDGYRWIRHEDDRGKQLRPPERCPTCNPQALANLRIAN